MKMRSRRRFLFISALFSGNDVFFQHLRDVMGEREDVEVNFKPIELEPKEFIASIPAVSLKYVLKNGLQPSLAT